MVAGILTFLTFTIILFVIALPISWLLMHGFNWICSAFSFNYSLDYWPMFIITLCIMVMLMLIGILNSKSKRTPQGKQWEHDMEMRWIESYTGKDYDYNSDPYDY